MGMDERVLGIRATHFEQVGLFTGFRSVPKFDPARLLQPTAYSFEPRQECETDPSFKQLIPYLVLHCGEEYFHYRRGRAGTEKRLQSLRSIGIGGHISEDDAQGGEDPLQAGLKREFSEEIDYADPIKPQLFGLVHDPRTLVGSVHVGVVYLVQLPNTLATARDPALSDSGWDHWKNLLAQRDQFETWSQFVLDELAARNSSGSAAG